MINEFDPAKSNSIKKGKVYDYWIFNNGFKYEYCVCNRCSNLLMMCVNISNIAMIAVKWVDYYYIIYGNSKSDAINLLQNSVKSLTFMRTWSDQKN